MQWLCRKPEIVYVPVPSFGRYEELSLSPSYLSEAINLADNRVWIVEITETVRILREMADLAKSPEELKAFSACIREVKKMLTISNLAKRKLEDAKVRQEQEK